MAPVDAPPASSRARCWIVGVLLAGYALFDLRVFLDAGLPLFFDAHSHLTRAWLASRALEAGNTPTWTFEWYGGYRLFEFYAPGWYLLTGALASLTGDVAAATKGLLYAGQVVSVLAIYGLLLRLGVGALPALFGALLFLHDAGRWRVLAVIGNHPTLFVYALTPFLLLVVSRADPRMRSGVGQVATGALLLTAMAVGHLTNSLFVLPALGAFACVWFWQRFPLPDAGRALAGLAACLLAVGFTTAFLTIPMLRGLPQVSLSLDVNGLAFDLEPVRIALGWIPGSMRRIFVATPGAFWCALALGAAALSLRERHSRWRAWAAGLCASLLSLALLGDRAATGLIFFLAPLCAAALAMASRAASERAGPAAALALQALAVAAVPLWHHAREQAPLRMIDPLEFAIYARIPDPADRGRTLDVTPVTDSVDGVYGQSSFSPYWTGRAIPFGGFPQGAPLAINLQLALLGTLVTELAAPQPVLSDAALDLLALLHVEWLVDRQQAPGLARLALDPASAERLEPGLLRLRHASPALFAPRVERLPGAPEPGARGGVDLLLARLEAQWSSVPLDVRGQRSLDALSRVGTRRDWPLLLPLLEQMRIQRAEVRADRFFVDPGLPDAEAAPSPGEIHFAVLAHQEGLERVEIQARASTPGFVRLAYSHDPELGLEIDGEATPFARDFLGGVVLPFPAGTHTIALEAPPATLRLRLLWLAGGVAMALAMLVVWSRIPAVIHSTRAETS